MQTLHRHPALVVGGGIGGLAAALALARRGHAVHLLEQAKAFGEIGAGLQLAPNAFRALERLGVLDRVKEDAVFPRQMVMLDAISGDPITSLDLGEKFRARYGHPYAVMHRTDLHGALLEACRDNPRISLETDRRVVSVENLGEAARVACADGSLYETGLLVGADGLHSQVRRFLGDDTPPVCARFVAYRGTVPIEEMTEHAGADNLVVWVGPDMHLVQYPVRRGELYNQVAVFKSYDYRPDSDDWGTVAELEESFSRASAPVRAGLKSIGRGRRWPLFDRPPLETWVCNRILLLGDAAHPMLQYLAQGACQALEDAVLLADLLPEGSGDPAPALARYQELRRTRTARVQLTAHFFGEVCHIGGVGAVIRNALLHTRSGDDYSVTDWLYGRNPAEPEQEDETAIARLRQPGLLSPHRAPFRP